MAKGTDTQEATSELNEEEKKEKKKKYSWLWIIIIAIVIVFVSLLLTVLLVRDFNSLGDLFNFIGSQL